jgi:glycosyltransferase involved in cell wall biosynthesis
MKILHIVPRWIGGGPERAILEIAGHDPALPGNMQRRVVVLDKPVSAPLFIRARRLGVALVVDPPPEELAREIEAADIVEVTYWNHPLLLDLLRRPLPPARLLIWSAIAGNTLPHILFPDLVALADCWVMSTPPGHGKQPLEHPHVSHVPALGDMTRLAAYSPQPHSGVRIAYLGSLAATKLHPRFPDIVAASAGPDMRFDLFGDADAATVTSLKQALQERDVEQYVSFHGHVELLAEAFASSDIFAYPLAPGSYVTSEKALQEAMWIGLPPVLMEGTAAMGWIERGVTGFIASDCEEFAATLTRLAADPALRKRIGDAARQMARRRFDPRRNAATMAEIYAGLARRPKRQRPAVPGAGISPPDRFLQSLGDVAGLFSQLVSSGQVDPATGSILNADILLRGEGGLMHYARSYPDADLLTHWAITLQNRIAPALPAAIN